MSAKLKTQNDNLKYGVYRRLTNFLIVSMVSLVSIVQLIKRLIWFSCFPQFLWFLLYLYWYSPVVHVVIVFHMGSFRFLRFSYGFPTVLTIFLRMLNICDSCGSSVPAIFLYLLRCYGSYGCYCSYVSYDPTFLQMIYWFPNVLNEVRFPS